MEADRSGPYCGTNEVLRGGLRDGYVEVLLAHAQQVMAASELLLDPNSSQEVKEDARKLLRDSVREMKQTSDKLREMEAQDTQ